MIRLHSGLLRWFSHSVDLLPQIIVFKWKSNIGVWRLWWHIQFLSWGHSQRHDLLSPMRRVRINIFIEFRRLIIRSATLARACVPPYLPLGRVVIWKSVGAHEVFRDSQSARVELIDVMLPVKWLACAIGTLRGGEVLLVGFECLIWLSIFWLIFRIFWGIALFLKDGWLLFNRITFIKCFLFQDQF